MTNIPTVPYWHSLHGPPGVWPRAENSAIAHDSGGNVYVAGCAVREMDTTMRYLQRFSRNGQMSTAANEKLPWYSATVNYADWIDVVACDVVVDDAHQLLYVLARARLAMAPSLPRFFLYAHDLASGNRRWSHPLGWSYDDHGHLDVDGSGNAWVATTDGAIGGRIKLTSVTPSGNLVSLPYDGVIYSPYNRELFGFGARKMDDSLYLAYKEDGQDGPSGDVVIARYAHDLTFLGKTTHDVTFQPPNDPNMAHAVHPPSFHDGLVDNNDRFVLGGFAAVDREILVPEGFGMHRIFHPYVLGFDSDGAEEFRYIDRSTSLSSDYTLGLDGLGSLPDEMQILARPRRARLKQGEPGEVLVALSQFPMILSLRDDGTPVDDERLALDDTERERIASCEYRPLPITMDFTYLSVSEHHTKHLVTAGGTILVGATCTPMLLNRPSVVSFHIGVGGGKEFPPKDPSPFGTAPLRHRTPIIDQTPG